MQIDESPTSPVQHASDHPPRPVKHIGRASLMENGKGGNTLDQIRDKSLCKGCKWEGRKVVKQKSKEGNRKYKVKRS
jgi:hypothetical protein